MKKCLSLALLLLALAHGADAQDNKNIDPKYRYCYKETSLETDDYKIYVVDAMNEDNFAKAKIRIFNKTNDYLIFKPSEFSFLINGQDIASKDKQMIVAPNDETARVIDVKGKGCQANKYTLEIKAYYKVPAGASVAKTEDFQLPAGKNDFKAGGFDCKMIDNKLKTDKSTIRFGCTYQGDGIGILDPYKASAVMPNGKDNANLRKYNPELIEKGKYEDFTIELKEINGGGDMQKAPFKIKWNETFRDSKPVSMKGSKIDLELDQEKTVDRNK